VFRAHAYELTGDLATASRILRELPDPRILELVRSKYPGMPLCPQSAASYVAAANLDAGRRAAASAGGIGLLVGGILALTGGIMACVGVATVVFSDSIDNIPLAVIGGILLLVGVLVFLRARRTGRRAAWLRTNGLSLEARVVSASRTGTMINDVPVLRFA